MQDNLSEKLANAAKKILSYCDNNALGGELDLRNRDVLVSIAQDATLHNGVTARFGEPFIELIVTTEPTTTHHADDGSVFKSVRVCVEVGLPRCIVSHREAQVITDNVLAVTTLAAELEEALDGPTWVLKMSAEEAMAKKLKDRREANETLASAILHTPEAKEALKRIKVGDTRVVKHPSVRLLEREGLPWTVQLPNGKAFRVKGMADEEGAWVTRDA